MGYVVTDNRRRKRAIRERMERTGEPYTLAARRHDEERSASSQTRSKVMSWNSLGDNRWTASQADSTTAYLRYSQRKFYELHVDVTHSTMHIYAQFVGVSDPDPQTETPLADVVWERSHLYSDLNQLTEAEAWTLIDAVISQNETPSE